MDHSELTNEKVNTDSENKYDDFFNFTFSPSKITSNFIMLVFLDLLVHQGQAYATQVKEIFNISVAKPGFLSLSNGNFYPVIKEMKEKGLIQLNGNTKGRAKYYEMTEKGYSVYGQLRSALKDEIDESIRFYKDIKSLIYE
jgi:DNA-binding PadR family transcriptional regulator